MANGRIMRRSGKWAYVISLPADPVTGKRGQKWKQGFDTQNEAKLAMRQALNELDNSKSTTRVKITVRDYLTLWMERYVVGKCAPQTERNYRNSIVNHINKAFGDTVLSGLQPKNIENFYTKLSETLSPSSVHTIHRVLRAALNRAVKLGYLQSSPLVRVDSPSLRTPKRTTLNVQQAKDALDWLKIHCPASYIGTFLAVFSGMRRGEICGLRWQDVDTNACVIHVKQTRQRIDGKQVIGAPKTELSTRSISVSADVMQVLDEWRRRHEDWHKGGVILEDELVVMQAGGYPIDPDTLAHDLHKAEKALELPLVSFHDLRHTHATILLEAGVDPKTVSERLGHSSIRVTMDTYAHVTNKMQKDAVDRLDKAFTVSKPDKDL